MNWSMNIKCTGCALCAVVCPRNAIDMRPDQEGFLHPVLQEHLCVDCGQCQISCPQADIGFNGSRDSYKRKVYAAKSKDENIRRGSTSGAMFAELAMEIIRDGGYVAGAYFDHHFQLKYKLVNRLDELNQLYKSKYVQAEMGAIYQEIEYALMKGKEVLFCGLPCQLEGVRRFFQGKDDKLILCALLCRGSASPLALDKYVKMLENQYQSKLCQLDFRAQEIPKTIKLAFEDGTVRYETIEQNLYMQSYYWYRVMAPQACYECRYKKLQYKADITLGDFWGLHDPFFDDGKGISLVMINTEKGRITFNKIKDRIDFKRSTLYRANKNNDGLLQQLKPSEMRSLFFEMLKKQPFDKVIEEIKKKISDNAGENL